VADRWQISTTHLVIEDPSGDELSIVSYVDGGCGIARNGTPLREYFWELAEMAEMAQCTQTLLRLAGRIA